MLRSLCVAAALSLSACGFTPVHAPNLGVEDGVKFKDIRVQLVRAEDISEDEGSYWLQQSLYDRLGTSGSKHTLEITSRFQRVGYGISSSDVETRFDMNANVSYRLIDIATGDVLDRGTVRSTSTFGAPRDLYGRTATQKNATQNVARDVADRLLVRVAAYYANAS